MSDWYNRAWHSARRPSPLDQATTPSAPLNNVSGRYT